MAYERINFQDGNEYGATHLNQMDEAIKAHDVALSGSNGSKAYKQVDNMGKAMKKLRTGLNTEFCFFGDSVFYAYFRGEGAIQEDCIPDRGESYSQKYGKVPTRNPITIYDSFKDAMNQVYENKVSIKKKLFSGHTAKWAYEDYNPSVSDFVILNFGINDAMGAHVPDDYKGKIEEFTKYYRLIIERELDNGTAVVLMTPVKQTLKPDSSDTDDRILIDVYEQVVMGLAKEYAIPVIDGNEITYNFGIDMCADFTHFTGEGNKAIGYKMASYFVGQGPNKANNICTSSYVSVNPQLDNVNLVSPTILNTSNISPNNTGVMLSDNLAPVPSRDNGGMQAVITKKGMVTWSFYCNEDYMIVVPCFYTPNNDVICHLALDFGAKQGQWVNYWYYVNGSSPTIDRNYIEPASISIQNSDMKVWNGGYCYGMHTISNTSPVLRVVSKGWHTVTMYMSQPQPASYSTLNSANPYSISYNVNDAYGVPKMSVIPDDQGDGSIQAFGISVIPYATYVSYFAHK